jgi:hypothetical protein
MMGGGERAPEHEHGGGAAAADAQKDVSSFASERRGDPPEGSRSRCNGGRRGRRRLHVGGFDDATGDPEVLLELGPVGGDGKDARWYAIGKDGGGGLHPVRLPPNVAE